MPPVAEADVLKALGTIQDPDLGRDLVTLGMIKDLAIKDDGLVRFAIVLTTPACPVKERFRSQAELLVGSIPGVTKVEVDMQAQTVAARPFSDKSIQGVRNVIAVGSGKGGVGKSTVASNLAVALRLAGAKVALVDADITGPNIPLMMGVQGAPDVIDGKIVPLENHGVKLMSIGFLVPEGTPVVWRSPLIHKAIQQFLYDVAWGEIDYLVIDLPPGTGDATLTVAQSVPVTGVVIVSTPQDVALLDATKSLQVFQKLEAPILGIVENMSGFRVPGTDQIIDIFGAGGAERAAKELQVPFLGKVPLNPSVRIGGDTGRPITVSDPSSEEAGAFREIADNVVRKISVMAMANKTTVTAAQPLRILPMVR